MERVLVTGATGFIGRRLTESLVQDGRQVRCLVRPASPPTVLDDLRGRGVDLVSGDLMDRASLAKAVEDVDVIYHLAAIFDYAAPRAITFKVNVEGTRNLLDACRSVRLEKFIHCSTIGVMGRTGRVPADETRPCHPEDAPYPRSKFEAEGLVREYHRRFGLPAVVVRPAAVYGPRDHTLLNMFQLALRGRFNAILGSGENLVSFVHVTDVVRALLLAEAKGRVGEAYIVANGSTTLGRFMETIARTLGTPPPTRHVPIGLVKFMAVLSAGKSRLVGGKPTFTRSSIDFATSDRVYDISKARNELGYEPRIGLEEGMRETVGWYRANGSP